MFALHRGSRQVPSGTANGGVQTQITDEKHTELQSLEWRTMQTYIYNSMDSKADKLNVVLS